MKISTKLILSFIPLAIIIIPLLAFTVFYSARNVIQQTLCNSQIQTAQTAMHIIDRIMYNAYKDIEDISETARIKNWLIGINTDKIVIEKTLEEKSLLTGPWDCLDIVNKDGIIVASTEEYCVGNSIKIYKEELIAYETAMRGEIYYSDLIISNATNKATILFSSPIKIENHGHYEIIGVVVGHFVWHAVLQVIDEVDPNLNDEIHLLNNSGILIGCVKEDNILKENYAHIDIIKKTLSKDNQFSIYESSNFENASVLGVYVRQKGYLSYKGKGWILLFEMPLRKLFAPIYLMAEKIAIIVSMLSIIIILLIYFFSNRLTQPIERLTTSIQSVTNRDFNAFVPVTTNDEVGVLSNSFNIMLIYLTETTVSKDYVESIMQHMADMLIVLNTDGIIKTVNEATLIRLGYAEKNELQGQSIKVLIEEVYENYYEELLKQGVIQDIESTFKKKDNNKIIVNLSLSSIHDKNGDIQSIICVAQDITGRKKADDERKKLISELKMKNDELDRFTYTVSHNLKSPLVTIKGFLGLLEQDISIGDTESIQSDIKRIGNAADKMKSLLDDLLTLSRIGRIINLPEKISVTNMVHEVVELLNGKITPKNIEIKITPNMPVVLADKIRMFTVFLNLIDNAIKFMGDQKNPLIEIGIRQNKEENIFCVKDNGIGIEPQYHEKIFVMFDKLNQDIEGTGIGLAQVKRIIEVHGGRIWVESDGLGKGSIFCFTINLSET
ncbi:MAG: PAS domain S-box protein [Desulfobacterales bacterium]|nr:PAS domain S-box protein [Desulfobacterales bacterium]